MIVLMEKKAVLHFQKQARDTFIRGSVLTSREEDSRLLILEKLL